MKPAVHASSEGENTLLIPACIFQRYRLREKNHFEVLDRVGKKIAFIKKSTSD